MKRILITAALSMATVAGFAQGKMQFENSLTGIFVAPIFAPDPGNSTLSLHGQANTAASGFGSAVTPTGTTVYNGSALQGTGYTLQLWVGASADNLAPVYTTSFRTASANKLPAGLVSGSTTVTFPTVDAGQIGFYDVRVWNNLGGTITTWAAALNGFSAGTLALGNSGVVASLALGGTDSTGGVHPTNPDSTQWTSFNIAYANVPEPTSLALFGLGAAGLMIFRRRK